MQPTKRAPGRPRQDACHRGHPLSGANLYIEPDGTRGCKACRAKAHADWRATHPERWEAIRIAARERESARRVAAKK